MNEEKPTDKSTPPMLDYSTGRYEKKPPSLVGEMLFGFGVWVGTEILVGGLLMSTANVSGSTAWMWILPAIALVVIIWMSVLSHTKWKMRGFIPGILMGLGITCLLPIGIVAVVCGNTRF